MVAGAPLARPAAVSARRGSGHAIQRRRKRRQKSRPCRAFPGKQRFRDRREADEARRRIGTTEPALRAYPCASCNGWHLGRGWIDERGERHA